MKPLDDILNRLHAPGEVQRKSREIFREINVLSKINSAHAIAKGVQAVPAACLYIASARLGYTEISKDVARHAACVDMKVFEKVQSIIERALLESPAKAKDQTITYQKLIRQHRGREDAHVPMAEVERAVVQSKEGVDTATPIFQGAIFSWVYINVLKSSTPDQECIRLQVHASPTDWLSARRIINKCCRSLKDTLIRQAETALSRPARLSQPSRTLVPITSSISSLPSSSPSFPVTPLKMSKTLQFTPSTGSAFSARTGPMKRKPSVMNIIEEISSPSKRPKTALYPSSTDIDLTAAVKTSNSIKEAQSRKTVVDKAPAALNGNDSEADIPDESIVIPTRRPPASHTDDRDLEPSLQTKTKTTTPILFGKPPLYIPVIETPSKEVVRIVETPMTTTGLSDASSASPIFTSPTEASRPRRVLSLPALNNNKNLHLPRLIDEEGEEITRRQRRNLRAAFLDPNVYGWKPSPFISRRLKLAESWEKRLIRSFGDPWDENKGRRRLN